MVPEWPISGPACKRLRMRWASPGFARMPDSGRGARISFSDLFPEFLAGHIRRRKGLSFRRESGSRKRRNISAQFRANVTRQLLIGLPALRSVAYFSWRGPAGGLRPILLEIPLTTSNHAAEIMNATFKIMAIAARYNPHNDPASSARGTGYFGQV